LNGFRAISILCFANELKLTPKAESSKEIVAATRRYDIDAYVWRLRDAIASSIQKATSAPIVASQCPRPEATTNETQGSICSVVDDILDIHWDISLKNFQK
jgi:hypothetical protein